MIRRKFTLTESVRLIQLAYLIRRDIDAQTADLVERLAGGDDTALPLLHDRLNVIGRPEAADTIRRLVLE